MARHFLVPGCSFGREEMRHIVLALFTFAFLLSACAPTASAGTPSIRASSIGYSASGLRKQYDAFTGRMVCEQSVTKLGDPHDLTITARLDANGVVTFSLTRRNVKGFVYHPYGDYGLLLRFASGMVRGYEVADNDAVMDVNADRARGAIGHQTHTLIVDRFFYSQLLNATQSVSYRLVDSDNARSDSVDGVLTVRHLAPLRDFYVQCL